LIPALGDERLGVTRITDQLYRIDASLPDSPGTVAVYVLTGSEIAIVDCGYATTYQNILQGLNEIGIQPSKINYLIPTHLHLDHSGGTGHLLHHTPNAQVIAHEVGVAHLVHPKFLIQSANSILGEEIMKIYGTPIPINRNRIVSVGKEHHIDLGEGLSLAILHAPGHAPHQIAIFIEEHKLLLSADTVGITLPNVRTMIPPTPPPSFEPSKLADTIDKLLKLDPRELLVPHYGVRKDARNVLQETKTRTEKWMGEVKSNMKSGLGFEEITDRFVDRISEEAGIRRQDLGIFIQRSVRISIMGIIDFFGIHHRQGIPSETK